MTKVIEQRSYLMWLTLVVAFLTPVALMGFISSFLPKPDDLVLTFPLRYDMVKGLSSWLLACSTSHFYSVLFMFMLCYLWKQTFAIPGSAFMNMIAGSLFGIKAVPMVCFLTALGSSLSYTVSLIYGKHLIVKLMPERIETLKKKIDENRDDLFFYMMGIRALPITPNWFINFASPIIDIPVHYVFVTALLGMMPYNFVGVQAGIMINQLQSLGDIFSTATALRIGIMGFVYLLPVLIRKALKYKKVHVS